MHIYQGERDLQDKSQVLDIPGKEIAMSSGQLSQVSNSFNTSLEYIINNLELVVIMSLGKYSLQISFWKNRLALTSKFLKETFKEYLIPREKES